MNADEAEIRALIKTWLDATKAGDSETVLGLMTEDVVFLVPGQHPFGKDVFRKASEEQHRSSMQFEGRSEILELKIMDDWAYMITKLSVTANQPDRPPTTRAGYTLTILRKESGKWLLARDANLLSEVKDIRENHNR